MWQVPGSDFQEVATVMLQAYLSGSPSCTAFSGTEEFFFKTFFSAM